LLLDKSTTSRDTFERTVAAWAVVRIAPGAESTQVALPLMIAALDLPNPEARIEAARTLGMIGDGSKPAMAALSKATSDDDETVRAAASEALKKLKR
jgi:HEAT repeat protein